MAPLHWEWVIGQPHGVQMLRNASAAEREAHAYLFAEPRSTTQSSVSKVQVSSGKRSVISYQ